MRVEPVDAHGRGRFGPVLRQEGVNGVLTGLHLVVGCDSVLEVEERHVGAGLGSLLQHAEIGGGDGEFRAVESITILHTDTVRHEYMDIQQVIVDDS